jgi:hypothetical protein
MSLYSICFANKEYKTGREGEREREINVNIAGSLFE